MAVAPGGSRRAGRYELIDHLASGGMADIFLAWDRGDHGFERLVVVKRILHNLVPDEGFVEMFLQEARYAARVSHPNVVQVFELGEEEGVPFLAMEYVPGCSLRELAGAAERETAPVPVGVAIDLVCAAAAGAHAIHELTDSQGQPLGLVHRDLTPHNLMVSAEGHVKILDFGIAKGAHSELTRTGMLKGKVAYMSPEQCLQVDLDRRSDVFTLGVVLWELLAGRRLFRRPTELATLQAIVAGEVGSLREARPDVPEAVAAVVHRALATDPAERPPTADALRKALVAAADAHLDPDAASAYVSHVLGGLLARRARAVDDAVERSITALTEVRSVESRPRGGRAAAAGALGALGALLVVAVGVVVVGLVALGLGGVGWWWWGQEPLPPRPEGEPVVLALAPVHDAGRLQEEWEPLRGWLEQRIERPVDLVVPASYGETSRQLLAGEVHFASLPPATYVDTHASAPEVVPLAIHVVDGSSGYDGLLVVREDHPATEVAHLAGARACFTDEGSTSGYRLARRAMVDAGLDPDLDLDEVRFSGSHDAALRDLVDGRCDVAATYSDAWQGASRLGIPVARTRILAVTGRSPHDAICASPVAPPEVVRAVAEALLDFEPQAHLGAQVLGETARISGFRQGEDADYDDTRAALE